VAVIAAYSRTVRLSNVATEVFMRHKSSPDILLPGSKNAAYAGHSRWFPAGKGTSNVSGAGDF